MTRHRISISGPDREAMLDLVRLHHIPVLDHGIRRAPGGGYIVDAIVDEPSIPQVKALGYQVTRHEDVDLAGAERQREIGQGDRYAARLNRKPPQGK